MMVRQKVAKALRKRVYGDFSLREPRDYRMHTTNKSIRVFGRRALYQKAKKKYAEDRRSEK